MNRRIVVPPPSPRRSQHLDMAASRRAALTRAGRVAAQADEARLLAMSPIDRAEAIRVRTARAAAAADRIRQEAADAVKTANVQRAAAAAGNRAIELHRLGRIAAKNGVEFDVGAVIASGIPLDSVRAHVMDAMADQSEAMVIRNRSTAHTAESANAQEGWGLALERVAARQGLKALS